MTHTPDIQQMLSRIKYISGLQRMINSSGIDQAFDFLKHQIPDLVIHEYKSGSESEDWIVPQAWEVVSGTMKDSHGKIIASIDDSPLFVAPYSEPADGWYTKDQIKAHLRTRPDVPDAFALEHRNAYDYQLNDWGITLPHHLWENLPDEKYHILIETRTFDNTMKVAEWFIKGKTEETICINAHIDELCNDDLSGCVVALDVMTYIRTLAEPKYSYQLLLSPELIGTLFFIHNNKQKINNTVGLINLESVGAGEKWVLKEALEKNSYFETVLKACFETHKIKYEQIDFFSGYGNDERVYAWPTINVPGVAIQRFPFHEYHTSKDTPEIIQAEYLSQAYQICTTFVDILEQNYVPVLKNYLPPWFTRRKLYFDREKDAEKYIRFNNLVMFNMNGSHSVLDLANLSGLNFFDVLGFLCDLKRQGLVKEDSFNIKG